MSTVDKNPPSGGELIATLYGQMCRAVMWLNSGFGRAAVLLIGALAGAAGLLRLWRIFLTWGAPWPEGRDFSLYLKAANAVMNGSNPYDPSLYPYDPYAYPPLTAHAVAVLSMIFGERNLVHIWPALCLFAIAASVFLVLRKFGTNAGASWVAFALGLILFSHVVQIDIYDGQTNFFIIALLLLGLVFRGEGKVWAAAVCWALIMNLKPFMGIVVLLPLWRGEWKFGAATLLIGALIFVASFALLRDPPEAFLGWVHVSRYYTGFEFSVHPNHQSFLSLSYRLFNVNRYTEPWVVAPWLPRVLIIPIAAVLAWLLARAIPWRGSLGPPDEAGARGLLEVSLVLAAWMCVSPTTEGDHMLLLAPGLAAAAMLTANRATAGAQSSALWLVALFFWLLALIMQALPFEPPTAFMEKSSWAVLRGPGILLSGYCGFVMLGAIAFSAIALRADRSSA
jgi:hypothetical protein